MSNIVLPKFKVPGEPPRWAMRALWATGGMVVVSLVVLGGVVVNRNSVDAKNLQANVRNVGGQRAEATAPPVAPAPAAATAPAPASVAEVTAASSSNDEPGADGTGRKSSGKHGARGHHGKRSRSHGKVAIASKSAKPAAGPAKKADKRASNEELDRILGLK